MLQLVGCQPGETGAIVAQYRVMLPPASNDAPPLPAGNLTLIASIDGCKVAMHLGNEALTPSEDEALNALADQLEAAAKAIRGRGECQFGIPVFG